MLLCLLQLVTALFAPQLACNSFYGCLVPQRQSYWTIGLVWLCLPYELSGPLTASNSAGNLHMLSVAALSSDGKGCASLCICIGGGSAANS